MLATVAELEFVVVGVIEQLAALVFVAAEAVLAVELIAHSVVANNFPPVFLSSYPFYVYHLFHDSTCEW